MTSSAPEESSSGDAELRRRLRITDMMLSAHSSLREHFERRALIIDVLLLAASALIAGLTFLDPALPRALGMREDTVRLWIGVISILLFALSVVALRVGWKEQAGKHERAVAVLGSIKARARELSQVPAGDRAHEVREFLRLADHSLGDISPIPDSAFVELKMRHLRKVTLSRVADRLPFAPLWLLRLRLWRRDASRALAGEFE